MMMMAKYLPIFLLSLFPLFEYGHSKLYPIEFRIPLAGQEPAPGTPWPKPQSIQTGDRLFSIDPKRLDFSSNLDESCPVITNAFKRYHDIILIDPRYRPEQYHTVIEHVHIYISDDPSCGYPSHQVSEEYWIEVPNPEKDHEALITARSVWGALRGLETFSQLIYANQHFELLLNETRIHDFPRYGYRGVLIDSARHFLPKKTLLANLDAMTMNKFNVFHWHLVDDQSFPFVSKRYPNISQYGAYGPKHTYSAEDVQEIIEYARMRGIRVIPELDTPGHTHAMARAFPELLTPCYGDGIHPYTPNYPYHSQTEVLNPMKNHTFEFMKEMFQEFRDTFKDEFINLGMDEVNYACWKSSPEISAFMRANNMKDYPDLEQYYVERTLRNVKDVGYKYMMYQDPVDNGVVLANDSIVVVWKDKSLDAQMGFWQDYIQNVAKKGYQIVLTACWYLNYISYPYPGLDWEKYYTCDPKNFKGTNQEKDLVIGGEACMWGEFVDATNLLSRLWPRASAVAERLWSNPNDTGDVDTARLRLDQHRCRMLRRGIPAAPILNGYCGDYEWDMEPNNGPSNGNQALNGVIPALINAFR